MTTADLLDIVARLEREPTWAHYSGPTIGMVSSEAGVSRREVEEACEVARREGAPILTSGAGIRIATHSSQLLDQYRRLRSRYVQQAVNARPVLAAAMRMKAQEDANLDPPATLIPPEPVYVEVPLWDMLDCEAA